MKQTIIGIFISIILLFSFIACNNSKENKPALVAQVIENIDGSAKAENYIKSFDFDTMKLSVSRTADRVVLTLSAKTTGWVAIGVGSKQMDGATIFMGYVDNGQPLFSEELGMGYRHSAVDTEKRLAEKYAVTEEGGIVTLVVECSAPKVIAPGAKELSLIIASSPEKSFRARHAERREVTVNLE